MLSACAGSPAPDPLVQGTLDERDGGAPSSYAGAVDAQTAGIGDLDKGLLERAELAAAHRADERRYGPDHRAHYHEEPSPREKAVAESILLFTGAAFLCTFVVVVLDGACSFGAHAGYYY